MANGTYVDLFKIFLHFPRFDDKKKLTASLKLASFRLTDSQNKSYKKIYLPTYKSWV